MKNLLFIISFILLLNTVIAQKNCTIITRDFVPIIDMEKEQFSGFSGGLYGNGSNIRPNGYREDVNEKAETIKPLDKEGKENNNGVIVMIGVGASNPRTEFDEFIKRCEVLPNKNPNLVLVNTCIGGQGIQKMNDENDNYWKQAISTISDNNFSEKQVQIAWIETENTQSADTVFPRAALTLMNEYQKLLVTLKIHFPNLKLCYVSARGYSGWISGDQTVGKGLLHPRDYYNGWALRFLIDSVISDKGNFRYSGDNAPIPLTTWGSYLWTNGNKIRKDGFSIDCENDIGSDGLHLSAAGEQKMGTKIFETFVSDESSQYWLLKGNTTGIENVSEGDNHIVLYPNPVSDGKVHITNITADKKVEHVRICSITGEVLCTLPMSIHGEIEIPDSIINNNQLYFVHIESNYFSKIIPFVSIR